MTAHKTQDEAIAAENRDPISGATGAHPVGTGIGAAVGGALAGAAAASVVGPVGTVVGAAVGAVAGGLFGKGVAEGYDPTVEDTYWREHYASRPYVAAGKPYDHYASAYRYGYEARARDRAADWLEAEPNLRDEWNASPHARTLPWNEAVKPVRDAWDRIPQSPQSRPSQRR